MVPRFGARPDDFLVCIASLTSTSALSKIRTTSTRPSRTAKDSGVNPEGPLGESKTHPRAYGTFPRILGKYVRDEKNLTLADAIRTTNITDNVSIGPGIQFDAKGQNDKLNNAAIQNRGGKLVTIAPQAASKAKAEFPMTGYDKRS